MSQDSERSEKSTPLPCHHFGPNGPVRHEVGSGKWEVGKVNYRALPRAKHSNRLFWPKFGFWALKENIDILSDSETW